MIVFPNAKINIGLNVIEKRADGFHNIESVFYSVNWYDMLEIIEGSERKLDFSFSGMQIPGRPENNLINKAYELIKKDYDLPGIKVHLHKNIPMGAGLGGGSADAAFFIKLLNEKFELNISWGEMHNYAKQLGSDCSFFITNKPVFAEQKGDFYERINIDLSEYFIVIIYPQIAVSTAEAYSKLSPQKPKYSIEEIILNRPIEKWKDYVSNDFEKYVFEKYPEIKNIKEKLYLEGALYASMSGSGSSVYGIFKEERDLKKLFPNYLIWESRL